MAIIAQKQLFEWNDVDNLGDLKRLQLVLENLPDEKLITALKRNRGNGRDDYPIAAVWNSIIAGIVFQHTSIASLIRELLRNIQLRSICGFDLLGDPKAIIPKSYNYSRFIKNLIKSQPVIQDMFNELVTIVTELLPDFGNDLAHDGKAIPTYAKPKKDGYKSPDGRRDTEANYGVKTYKGVTKEGKPWESNKFWFGYELHLLVDSKYELPIAFDLTKASVAEQPKAREMINILEKTHLEILRRAQYYTADKGYDDGKLITRLWNKHKIRPVIDIRNLWKDSDTTKGLSTGENVVFNYKGDVSCVCPKSGELKQMSYGGFEKDRSGHKYLCTAYHNGVECKGLSECPIYKKKYVRISMKEDRRIFTPLARSSYKWKKKYNKRTSVERVNSRVDLVYGFENHFIKGRKKMKLRLSLAFCVMLAMAVGRINEKKIDLIASLVKAA